MNRQTALLLFSLFCWFIGMPLLAANGYRQFVPYTMIPIAFWVLLRVYFPDLLLPPSIRYSETFKKFDEGWTPEELAEAAAAGEFAGIMGTILSNIPLLGYIFKLLFLTQSYGEKLKDYQKIYKKYLKNNS